MYVFNISGPFLFRFCGMCHIITVNTYWVSSTPFSFRQYYFCFICELSEVMPHKISWVTVSICWPYLCHQDCVEQFLYISQLQAVKPHTLYVLHLTSTVIQRFYWASNCTAMLYFTLDLIFLQPPCVWVCRPYKRFNSGASFSVTKTGLLWVSLKWSL